MRTTFHAELRSIERRIVDDLELAAGTVEALGAVLRDPSQPTPRFIETNAERLRDSARLTVDRLVTLMARQSPVASDLRLLTALMQIVHHEGLVANQLELITDQLMETDPDEPHLMEIDVRLDRMARLAAGQITAAAGALTARDAGAAEALAARDHAINVLNREVFDLACKAFGPPGRRATAMHQMLIARSLERIGDNAVDIAEQVAFIVTGSFREFTDASHDVRLPGATAG
jgi:phosphate transport system protein